MKNTLGKWLPATLAAFILASFAMAPYAEAAGGRGGGGGGGGGARASGGGGGGGAARASGGGGGGGQRQGAQASNSRADARTTDVRSNSVNNVNVDRNVNVNVDNHGGWDNDYHPVARAAAVGATVAVTSAVIGSMVQTVPPNCVPVNYGGMVYQQCGGAWYQPQGSQYVVVNAPY